ncbi:MAG: OmpH family outer membrane protein [Alphaproteobacteria bacterium]|nr:OmpH family outer membrane protein [Alphaproteobacteria bacterium]
MRMICLFSTLVAAASLTLGDIAVAQQQPQSQQQQRQRPAAQPAQPQPASQPAAAPQPELPKFPAELPPSGSQIVIVDGRLVMTQSQAALGLRQQAERQNTALRADVQRQEAEFKKAQEDLQRDRTKLAQPAFDQKVRDLQKRMADAQGTLQTRTRSLDRAFAEAEGRIYQAMLQASVEIAQEKSYVLILDKAQVVVVQSQLEITGEILKRVNQKLPTVPLQLPAN